LCANGMSSMTKNIYSSGFELHVQMEQVILVVQCANGSKVFILMRSFLFIIPSIQQKFIEMSHFTFKENIRV
jgi:hypothetical protein